MTGVTSYKLMITFWTLAILKAQFPKDNMGPAKSVSGTRGYTN